jgi:hypothetical protein
MVWSKTAEMYMRSFEMARRQVAATMRKAVGRRRHSVIGRMNRLS